MLQIGNSSSVEQVVATRIDNITVLCTDVCSCVVPCDRTRKSTFRTVLQLLDTQAVGVRREKMYRIDDHIVCAVAGLTGAYHRSLLMISLAHWWYCNIVGLLCLNHCDGLAMMRHCNHGSETCCYRMALSRIRSPMYYPRMLGNINVSHPAFAAPIVSKAKLTR